MTITLTKKEIFDLVNQRTIYLSDPVGAKEAVSAQRIADVIPLTKDDNAFFEVSLTKVGNDVYSRLAYATSDIENPFIISGNDDPDFPDPLILYKFNLYSGANENMVVPQVQKAIVTALVNGIIAEWLTVKGYFEQASIYNSQYEQSLSEIKSAMMFGQRAKKVYHNL